MRNERRSKTEGPKTWKRERERGWSRSRAPWLRCNKVPWKSFVFRGMHSFNFDPRPGTDSIFPSSSSPWFNTSSLFPFLSFLFSMPVSLYFPARWNPTELSRKTGGGSSLIKNTIFFFCSTIFPPVSPFARICKFNSTRRVAKKGGSHHSPDCFALWDFNMNYTKLAGCSPLLLRLLSHFVTIYLVYYRNVNRLFSKVLNSFLFLNWWTR